MVEASLDPWVLLCATVDGDGVIVDVFVAGGMETTVARQS
jgi:hypothetical protein